jgi:hypothetical protein
MKQSIWLVVASLTVSAFADVLPPDSLTYNSPAVYTVGVAITPNTPFVVGTVDVYTSSPALPPGLTLDSLTGIISGTPVSSSAGTDYLLIATNGAGSDTDTVNITVNEKPNVTSDPANRMVNAGSTVKFGVTATGTLPLTYKWLKNGTDSVGNADTLMLSNVFASDTGSYKCVITNIAGVDTSASATLGLNVPAFVVSNPLSDTVLVGQMVKFGVTATGTLPRSYKWLKNGTDSVGNSDTLTISSAVLGDSGSYTCVVTNIAGADTSDPAMLTVWAPANVSSDPTSKMANIGSTVKFGVVASGTLPLTYKWLKNGTDSVGNSDTLTLSNVSASDTGSYKCIVTNIAGADTSASATLGLNVPASVASNPMSDTVLTGTVAKLGITATGTLPRTYKWLKNGTDSVGNSDTLTIASVALSDSGSYACIVTNIAGADTSDPALLTVWALANVATDPANQMVNTGSTVKFGITGTGTAPLSYKWLKNGTDSVGNSDTLTLVNVQNADVGSYKCVVTNIAGSDTSAPATLGLNVPASIASNPVNDTAVAGEMVKIGVTAIGTAPKFYKWLKNGTDSVGNADTLTFALVQPTDSGTYVCIVRNMAGSDTSDPATVTVRIPPMVDVQPVNRIAGAGNAVTFHVTATGTLPLSYKWLKNGTDSVGNSDTLTLDSLQLADSGSYTCVVSNMAGTNTSTPATLTVHMAATIDEEPMSLMVNPGSTVHFGIKATGMAPLVYTWLKNGTDTVGNEDTLTLINVQNADIASYTCIVKNDSGADTSASVTLALNVIADVSSNPASQMVNAGSTVKFGVTATGTAPLSYKWLKNGTDSVGHLDTLVLVNVQSADTGSYKCVVRNIVGTDTSAPATLALNVPVNILSQTGNQMANAGSTIKFSVNVSGTAPFTYKWLKNGIDSVGNSDTLTLMNFQAADTGSYTCFVTNVAGADTSVPSSLGLNIPAVIASNPVSDTILVGGSVTFGVTATGTAPLSYKWLKNGTDSVGSSDTLVVSNAHLSDSGTYTCVVRNVAGSDTSDPAVLTVWMPSTINANPVSRIAGVGDTVKFRVIASGTLPQTYKWLKNGIDSVGNSDTLTIAGLVEADSGAYMCIVTNIAGSDTSAPATLIVHLAATIDEQPVSRTVTAGQSVKFGVKATGQAPLSYKWLKNGTDSVGNSDTLTIPTTVVADSGVYTCVVTNGSGSDTSDPAVLTVRIIPLITSQSASDTATLGISVKFGITAIGTPAISYKWIKNGTDSVGNMDTLTFASIQASDSGSYKCVVTNVAGADTSDPIRLTVILPPVITYSTPVAIYKRDTIAIPNTIVSTGGPVSVFHINPALPTGLSFDTLTGTISGTPDGQSNPANYQVIGSGRGGTDTAMVNISVYTPPTSLSYPDDYVTYVLNVPFVANVPTVNALVTHYSISPALPPGLTLDSLTGAISGPATTHQSFAANYTVTASNPYGSIQTLITLAVVGIPSNLSYPDDIPTYSVSRPISPPNIPTVQGIVTSYSISPVLPTGLTFDLTTGYIQGTPPNPSPSTVYTITATNPGGTTQTTITMRIIVP